MEGIMEMKQMAERINSVAVRKKAKRLLALTMAVLMVNPVTGYGVSAHAQEAETITAFAKLSSEIATQQLVVGSEESDINLPDTLDVTLSVYEADTTESIVKDSQPEEIPAEEAKPDESTSEEPAADESPADDSTVSDNDAEEPQEDAASGAEDNTATDSQATVVLDSGEVPLAASTTGSAISADSDDADIEQTETETITTEERTLTGITWQINAERSGSDTFDSANAGAVFFYEPILPEGYTLADGVSLPQIRVQIEDSGKWAFSQSTTIDGVEITVKAEKYVFPEGAVLHAEKVTNAGDNEKIEDAVTREVQAEDSAKTVAELVSFDITITDADGNELQPDTGKGEVRVSFAQLPMVTEDTTPTQELKVFHMDDSLSEAKGLDTTVNQETESVEASAQHFSLYTVALLTATAEDGEASVTDSAGEVTYYDTIEEAITAAQSMSGSTVTLLKDVQTETLIYLTEGTFTLDLNGKTWGGVDNTQILYIHQNAVLTIMDSGTDGTITTNGIARVIYSRNDSLILKGGSFEGGKENTVNQKSVVNMDGLPVGNFLADGYIYRSLADDSWIQDTSGRELYNVKVVPAPVKITAQPEDMSVSVGYSESPVLSVFAQIVPENSSETITYQWYSVGTGIDDTDELIDGEITESFTIPENLANGEYQYYCELRCGDYNVKSRTVTLYVTEGEGKYEVISADGKSFKTPTLEVAINAAKSKQNSTVKLLGDANTNETIELNQGTFSIDLNGYTWTAEKGTLWLRGGSNITLKDSGTNGVLQSRSEMTINVMNAPLTIEGGTYKNLNNTDNANGYVLRVTNDISLSEEQAIVISGGNFEVSDSCQIVAALENANIKIINGVFLKTVKFSNCTSVILLGGEFWRITTLNGTVADLLASGYAYKQNSTWVNDISGITLSNVTVQPVPAQITAQPQNAASVTYGYTEAPAMSVTAEKTAAAPEGSTITYQWYRVKSGDETSDTVLGTSAAQTLPTGLDTGTHNFYCVVTCDGYILNSESATFTVEQKDISASTLALDIPEGGYIYDKTAKTPAVTLTLDGHTLALGTDYILDYMDNTDAGTASVTITGQGNYTGTKGGTFNIKKATASITLEIKGAGADDEIMYGSAVTYTVRVTGVDGVALTDASIVAVDCIDGGNPVGHVMEYNTEKGAYFISQTDFRTEKPGTYPFYAIAVFPEASDTYKNYALGENDEVKSANISKTVLKADTSIAFNSSYTGTYFYTGSPVSNPAAADLSIAGASYSNVTFVWYDSSSNQLDTPPTAPGSYILAVSIPENDYFKPSSNTKSVTIGSYDGTVTVAYNGSTTKADWYTGDVQISADGYTVSDSADGTYAESYLLSGEGEVSKTLYFKQNATGYITDGKSVSVSIDKTAPAFSADTDGITISDNNWKGFLNNITFGHFFKENKDVSISATDSGSGVSKYYYYIDTTGSTTLKTAEELNAISFTEGGSFSISSESKYVIYAYAVDAAGNKSAYICTDGIVIDKTAPTVTLTAPTGSDLGDVSGAAKVKMNETGIISYVIKTTEQSGITAQNILDSTEKNTVSVTDGQADTNLDVALSGLTASTTYYMYAVGTDSAQNNGSVVSTSFTTTTTQPVFNDNPTITGTYGQQVKDMTVSQVASTNGVAGSWSVSSTDKPSVGTTATYDVVFTPNDAVQYATVTRNIVPTVLPKSLTAEGVSIGEISGTYTYDGTEKKPVVTVSDSAATITESDYEYSYSNNINAGTATVTITAKGNYTGTVSRTFTIAKATAPSITFPTAGNITYGQKLSASTLTGGSTAYGTFAWANGDTVPTVENSGYAVTFTPSTDAAANYDISATTESVSVSVSKAAAAVSVSAEISGNVGSRQATLTATVTGSGDGDIPAGTIQFVNTTGSSTENIGSAITLVNGTVSFDWTGLADQNYTVKAVYSGNVNYNTADSSELEVDTRKQNQAAFSIGSISPKTYGDGSFALSTTGGSGTGAVTFESSDSSILSISGSTATIHKAGTVSITAAKAEDSNYNEAVSSVSLTIGKKSLTVRADDQLNIVKGAAMPELTYTITGLVGGDTFTEPTISPTAADTSSVGEYAITISGGTLANADSYTVTYVNGRLTVVSAVYTVTFDLNGGARTGGGELVQTIAEGGAATAPSVTRSGYTFTGWDTAFANVTTNLTVKANWNRNSSGGNGGGSSSGGGTSSGSTSTTTTPEKSPNQPVTATTPVTATAGQNGAASAAIPEKSVTDAIAKAQADAKAQGKTANGTIVALNITMPKGTTSLTANLTRNSLNSLVSAGVTSLELNGFPVKVTFDTKALTEIQKQSSGNISISIVPNVKLSTSAKTMIGARPVYDLSVNYTKNGKNTTVTSFGGGVATVSIPYTLAKKEAVGGLYAVYVDEKGNATRIAGSAYDTNSGCVIFTTTHFSVYGIGYTAPSAKFTDISSHWAKESIDYVVGRGLLSGTSETTFAPNTAMTRGMLVTALGRLANVDTKAYTTNSFTDVKADSTFRPYIEWAYKNSIVQGTGNGKFEPNRAITREEIAVIFSNFAKATGYTLPVTRTATTYADASSIGSAYKTAVTAMQQAGIMMGGSGNKFNPKSSATRAEVSSMLSRYIKLTIDPDTAQGWAKNDAGQYLYYKDGKALTGTQTINGVKYFFNTDGTLKTGWVKDGGNWRFYSGNIMLVGFWDIGANGNNKTYYFTKDGIMVSGKWLEIDGKWYYFYADGSLARSTKIDEYEVDENGVRKTK